MSSQRRTLRRRIARLRNPRPGSRGANKSKRKLPPTVHPSTVVASEPASCDRWRFPGKVHPRDPRGVWEDVRVEL
jgi:hypothetical protein